MVEKQNVELKLIHMEDVVSKEVEWLWYPYIPYGKITIIEGDPGEGKTTLVLKLAAALSRGLPLPCDDDKEYEPIDELLSGNEGRGKKKLDIRGVQLRKHSKAREKRYSFGYAVSFIFACYQILWTFPKSLYLCSRYLLLAYG